MSQRESRRAQLSALTASSPKLDSPLPPLPPAFPNTGLCFSLSCPEAGRALALSPCCSGHPTPAVAAAPLRPSFSLPGWGVLCPLSRRPRPEAQSRASPSELGRFTSPSPAAVPPAAPHRLSGSGSAPSSGSPGSPAPRPPRPAAEHPAGGTSPSLPPSPRPRAAPVMGRASPSPSSAPSNAPSNRATSAPAGPIRAGNMWEPTSAGCGREVIRSSVAAGTRRSCRHHLHRHHLLQEQQAAPGSEGRTGSSPPSGAGARRVSAVELAVAGDSELWGRLWQRAGVGLLAGILAGGICPRGFSRWLLARSKFCICELSASLHRGRGQRAEREAPTRPAALRAVGRGACRSAGL